MSNRNIIRIRSALCGMLVLPTLVAATDKAGTLDEAEKIIIERFAQVRSFAAVLTTLETADPGDGSTAKAEIKRRIEWIRKGDGFLYRAESTTRKTRTHGDKNTTEETTATTVSDGAFVVTIAEQNGEKTATKRKADVTTIPDIQAMLVELRKDHVLSRRADVILGVDDCYAIKVVPKDRKGTAISHSVIYFRKDIGLDVRTVVYDKNNKLIYTSTTTDIRLNPDLSPDRFVVVLPDGVKLVDLTGQP
ncbi:MAG: hypothetical protein Q7R41_13335 [Phycisphaerales bacterium]|nr:hypothetical protein [Phycisphaerales bacterium]